MTDTAADPPAEPLASPARRRPSARHLAPLRGLLPFALRYPGRIAGALVALAVASAATLAIPTAVSRVIDFGFRPESAGMVNLYFGALIGVVGVLAASSALRFALVVGLGERVVADLRSALFAHLVRLDAAFHDTARAGDLVSRLTADTTQVKNAFGASASVALRNVVLFAGAVGMMLYTAPALSALVLGTIPLIVLPLVAAGRRVRERARLAQDRLADAAAFATEQVGAARTLQAFGAEARVSERFAAAAEDAYASAMGVVRQRAWLTAIVIFLVFAAIVGVLWWGAQDVMAGRMTAGHLSQFILYAVFAGSALSQLTEVWGELSAAAGAAARIGELMGTAPQVVDPAAPARLPPPRGALAFEAVAFAYPARPDAPVLRGASFRLEPGERVALVGPSGAGKSTVLALALRHYDPQGGAVLLDGIDLRSASLAEARARIALVPQDPVIFSGSVLDNILYARPGASEAEALAAARRAAVDRFAEALPQGYATQVGERGVALSGGQRQRLAVARALLKDAPLLLLDEATSALDAESEALVQAGLAELMRGRTSLVVAHRLATVRDADRLLVLDAGRVVEEGPHEALLAADGLYARLARLQFGAARAAE